MARRHAESHDPLELPVSLPVFSVLSVVKSSSCPGCGFANGKIYRSIFLRLGGLRDSVTDLGRGDWPAQRFAALGRCSETRPIVTAHVCARSPGVRRQAGRRGDTTKRSGGCMRRPPPPSESVMEMCVGIRSGRDRGLHKSGLSRRLALEPVPRTARGGFDERARPTRRLLEQSAEPCARFPPSVGEEPRQLSHPIENPLFTVTDSPCPVYGSTL